ncbi:MAG: hypothetical protein JWQ16_2544 [Novosphingobium sp.]|nr:hypothetical protein [Novosphingobium sp.]
MADSNTPAELVARTGAGSEARQPSDPIHSATAARGTDRHIMIRPEMWGSKIDVVIEPPLIGEKLDRDFNTPGEARAYAASLRLRTGLAIADSTKANPARTALIVAETGDGRFGVTISPADTVEEVAFAPAFDRADDARAFAREAVATWGNVFDHFVDLTAAEQGAA